MAGSTALARLEKEYLRFANGEHLQSARDIALVEISLLLPAENISTTECAVTSRYMANPEGGGKQLWSLSRTPYMAEIQSACDDPKYNLIIVVGPERSGKALDIKTPIATPDGWTTMGDLEVGNSVFGPDGRPTRVTAVSEVQRDHNCLSVKFSDGAEIVCDEEHLWEVFHSPWGGDECQSTKVLEAKDLSKIAFRKTSQGTTNLLSIDVTKPLDLPQADLPIPPYTLGAWIGDGTAATGDITLHQDDSQTLREIEADGFSTKIKYKPRPGNLTVSILTEGADKAFCARGHDLEILGRYKDEIVANGRRRLGRCVACARMDSRHYQYGSDREVPVRRDTMRARLERCGVLGHKHIPEIYLRASIEQRMALLQGWMDTDGHISPKTGRCELVTVEPRLAEAAVELVLSLGLKPSHSVKQAFAVNGEVRTQGRDAHRICFTAYSDIPVFRLARKRILQRPRPLRSKHTARRRIVSITPVASRPVRCIRVDNDRHLFLAGRDMIPTHNSVGGENLLFKRLKHGPLTDTIIYLQAGSDVDSYADKEFSDLFELHHDDIGRHLSPLAKFNKRKLKVCKGKRIQLLPANDNNLRQKQAPLIIATEVDGYRRPHKAIKEILGRQKAYGQQAKAYIESHPDLGWDGAIVPGWQSGTMAVFYWQCPSCGGWSTPHQLAPDTLRATLFYERDNGLDAVGQAEQAQATALLKCPHNGCLLDDEQRYAMIDGLVALHDGMTITDDGEVVGEAKATNIASFWLHGFNVKRPLGPLAREHVEAMLHFEKTRKIDLLKRYHVKSLGEVFESASDIAGLTVDRLIARTRDIAMGDARVDFRMGTAPDWVRFVTVAVDVGHHKLDVLIRGWDLHGRSAIIDRHQITQIERGDGVDRSLDLTNIQDDWHVLDKVLDRLLPRQSDPTMALPVAVMTVDSSDGNVTNRAYEYARRSVGRNWLGWQRVRCIKGVAGKRAHLGAVEILSRDTTGKVIEPKITFHTLGVDGLKDDILGNDDGVGLLAIDDGSPGQMFFPEDFPRWAYHQIFNEKKIDGKYDRGGRANETLDLLAYTEAGRLMLEPDRKDRIWTPGNEPIWAKPVSLREREAMAQEIQSEAAPTVQPAADNRERLSRFLNT